MLKFEKGRCSAKDFNIESRNNYNWHCIVLDTPDVMLELANMKPEDYQYEFEKAFKPLNLIVEGSQLIVKPKYGIYVHKDILDKDIFDI